MRVTGLEPLGIGELQKGTKYLEYGVEKRDWRMRSEILPKRNSDDFVTFLYIQSLLNES